MANVLIVGFGYFGKTLGEWLIKQGHQVWGIKRTHLTNHQPIPQHVQMLWQDLHSISLNQLPHVDVVVYCPSTRTRTASNYQHTYLKGSQYWLKLCQAMPSKPKLVFLSSTSVYHQNDGSWINEHSLCEPNNSLSQIIAQAEGVLDASKHPTLILRSTGIYGDDRHYLLDALQQGNASLCYDTRYSNRIHILDLARATSHLMFAPSNDNLFLLGDCEPTPINTIVAWLSSTTGIALPEQRVEHSTDNLDHRSNKRISNAHLLETGFSLEFPSFKSGFKDILLKKGLIPSPNQI